MLNGFEPRERFAADALRGAIGRDQFRMISLDFLQTLDEVVILLITDFRSGIDVIQAVVAVDLRPQRGCLALDVLVRHER